MNLEVGKVYEIVHSRKGTFTGKVLSNDGEWADVEVTSGVAGAMAAYNEREDGETVTLRVAHVVSAKEAR